MSELRHGRDAARQLLGGLFADAPVGSWVELRFRAGSGMRRSFHRSDGLDAIAERASGLASWTDVFVGVVARARKGGGRGDLVERVGAVWVDCDGPSSVRALAAFRPKPSILVASGSGQNRHAYWLLRDRVGTDRVEDANVRLAVALGADLQSCDSPRIMRVAGTMNRKRVPATSVQLLICDEGARVGIEELVEGLARQPKMRSVRVDGRGGGRADDPLLLRAPWTVTTSDPVRSVPPPVYFERLTGLRVGQSGKLRCLFHDDRSPSLHVYREPGRGWYCFGCGRGGSIYDLAALLSGRQTRGSDFSELRRELEELMLPLSLGSHSRT